MIGVSIWRMAGAGSDDMAAAGKADSIGNTTPGTSGGLMVEPAMMIVGKRNKLVVEM
jgi:hypothetical protein